MFIVAYIVSLVIIVLLVVALMRLSSKVEAQEDLIIERDKDIVKLRNSLECAHAINDKAQVNLSNSRKLYGRTLREKHQMTEQRDVAEQMLTMVLNDLARNQPSTV